MKVLIIILIVQLFTVVAMNKLMPVYMAVYSFENTIEELENIHRGFNIVKHIPVLSQFALVLMLFVLSTQNQE